jgi:putative inorganic carbon (HCO3(-)) transporter
LIKQAQQWALRAGAFLLPLAFLPGSDDPYVRPRLLFAVALAAVLASLLFIHVLREGSSILRRTPLDIPLVGLALSALLSTIFSANLLLSIFGAHGRDEGLLTLLLYVGLFWLAAQTLEDWADIRNVLRAFLASAYLLALLGIVQVVLVSALIGEGGRESAQTFGGVIRASATMGNPVLLASFLAMMLPVAIGELLAARTIQSRLIAFNLVTVMTIALALTFSRAAWVGALLGSAIPIWYAARRSRLGIHARGRQLATLAAAAIVLMLGSTLLLRTQPAGLPIGSALLHRVESFSNLSRGSLATRVHVWSDTIRLVESRPLIGYGPDTFGRVYPTFQSGNWTPGFKIDKAHSDVLQVAATQGLLGVAAYLGVLISLALTLWRIRTKPGIAPLAGAISAYEVVTQLSFSWLPSAAPFWLLVGGVVALALRTEPIASRLPAHPSAARTSGSFPSPSWAADPQTSPTAAS